MSADIGTFGDAIVALGDRHRGKGNVIGQLLRAQRAVDQRRVAPLDPGADMLRGEQVEGIVGDPTETQRPDPELVGGAIGIESRRRARAWKSRRCSDFVGILAPILVTAYGFGEETASARTGVPGRSTRRAKIEKP